MRPAEVAAPRRADQNQGASFHPWIHGGYCSAGSVDGTWRSFGLKGAPRGTWTLAHGRYERRGPHATGQAGDLSRPQDDADADGMSNLLEYQMGTDPTSAASAFHIEISNKIVNFSAVLSWPAAKGRTYRVQYKNHLDDASWVNLSAYISVINNRAQITVPAPQSMRFYRVLGFD